MLFNKHQIEINKFENDLDAYIYFSTKKQEAIRKRENDNVIAHLEITEKKGKLQLQRTINSYCENHDPKTLMNIVKTRADECDKKIEKLRIKGKSTVNETIKSLVYRQTKLMIAKNTLDKIF